MGSRVLFLVLATSTLCFSSTFRVTLRPATTIFTNGVTPTVDPITVTLRDPPPVNYISPLFIYNLGSVNIDATQFAARPDYGTQLRYQRNGTPPGFGYDLLQITGSTSWQDSGTEYVQNYGLEYDPTSPYSYATYSYPLSLAYYQYNAGSGMWESSLSLRDTFQSLHDTNKAVLFSIAQLTHVNTV